MADTIDLFSGDLFSGDPLNVAPLNRRQTRRWEEFVPEQTEEISNRASVIQTAECIQSLLAGRLGGHRKIVTPHRAEITLIDNQAFCGISEYDFTVMYESVFPEAHAAFYLTRTGEITWIAEPMFVSWKVISREILNASNA